jgi:class 3 adenylate cyclase
MPAPAHTFLFADLVGFTALAESEGDDRALEVVLALQRRVGDLLAEQLDDAGAAQSGEAGGRAGSRPAAEQVKAIGDGLMLRCDEPEAAIRLALRLVDELGDEPGIPPVRVGIHTGPAVANDGDWYGRTVNVAARLCAVAPGGEVMVSEATRAAAGGIGGVDWGERELHWLRNVSEPVGTYLASRCEERRSVASGRQGWRWSCPHRVVGGAPA